MRQSGYRTWIARGIARALLADVDRPGATTLEALQARAAQALGERPTWLTPLLEPLAALSVITWRKFDVSSLARRIEVTGAFERCAYGNEDDEDDEGGNEPGYDAEEDEDQQDGFSFGQIFEGHQQPRIRRLILRPALMRPRPLGLESCLLPEIATAGDLARWLKLTTEQLNWLAPEAPAWTEHYRYRLLPKNSGGLRLLEVPKVELKRVQRQLLTGLLRQVPVHEAAHGFTCGRSIKSHAAAHLGQAVVIRFDLRDFFGSVSAAQVRAVWYTLGYPEGVARALTALCTHRTARMVVERMAEDGGLTWMGAKRLRSPHLPQGGPTSPVLANLCAFGLDLRLEGLAHVFGASYTRYADDLVFSGPESLRRQFRALEIWVAQIARTEGFTLHNEKTRCLPRHRQQRITGVVVNERINVTREDFDRLKACLHQSALHGPASQNRERHADFRSHLLGRIGWVAQLNPPRAEKLMKLFERIEWAA
ncbi:reverse transcriptase family protein [Polaromonas sp.]|uniref:reverse transcriptase family protein n=1 Tax=Polaromonas sp. TaxID=1869339 RepID=UPI003263BF7B